MKEQDGQPDHRTFARYDAEMLLSASHLYVCLHSLIMLHKPDPDYFGITNEAQLDTLIGDALERVPEADREKYVTEVNRVKNMGSKKLYKEAIDLVSEKTSQIGALISDGREPPERLKPYLSNPNRPLKK